MDSQIPASRATASDEVTQIEDVYVGALVSLGFDGVEFLLSWLGIDPDSEDELHPALGLFTSFMSTAVTMVEESSYFDLDYRSEVAELIDSSFDLQLTDVARLHFFSEPVGGAGERIFDYVERAREAYLGYTIISPSSPARIGRSIVSPMTRLPGIDDPVKAASQIRTAVMEPVQLFGISLVATGVPFMEQDGNLLRCAHVSAWMCHYAAVLRGAVSRRPSAHFHRSGDAQSIGRRFPSSGVSTQELTAMLTASDLPPDVMDADALGEKRPLTWADRSELLEAVKVVESDPEELKRLWIHENLAAAVCRYLNSGIPVILARDSLGHTQVVVGYLREKDLSPRKSDGADTHSDVVAFIVSDDQKGPYVVVPIGEIVEEFTNEAWAATQLVVPLPRSLWMSGDAAERIASITFPAAAKGRKKRLRSWARMKDDPKLAATHQRKLGEFEKGLTGPGVDKYTIRTYATTGVDFKDSFSERIRTRAVDDDELVRGAAVVHLPKYVWVVEVLDRALRRAASPSVVATMVLDATHTVHNLKKLGPADLAPLFVHLPGQSVAGMPPGYEIIAVGDEDDDVVGREPSVRLDDDNADFWITTSFEPYSTGRWSHERLGSFPRRVQGQAKIAISSGR